jgi:hypothetical protein
VSLLSTVMHECRTLKLCTSRLKNRKIPVAEFVFTLLEESGVIIMFILIVGNYASMTSGYIILLAALVFGLTVLVINNAGITQKIPVQVISALVFMFLFTIFQGAEIKLNIAGNKILAVPLTSCILAVFIMAWIVGIVTRRKMDILKNEIFVSVFLSAALLIFLAMVLFILIGSVYDSEPRYVLRIVGRVVQYAFVSAFAIHYTASRSGAKRLCIYLTIVFILVLALKGISLL